MTDLTSLTVSDLRSTFYFSIFIHLVVCSLIDIHFLNNKVRTLSFRLIWRLVCSSLVGLANAIIKEANYSSKDIFNYDVVVMGGGVAGAYDANRLRDFNKTVAVVEIKGRHGGHTETYTHPISKASRFRGHRFHNTDLVKNYFGRFNIFMGPMSFEVPGVITG